MLGRMKPSITGLDPISYRRERVIQQSKRAGSPEPSRGAVPLGVATVISWVQRFR